MTTPAISPIQLLPAGCIMRPMTMDDADGVVDLINAASQKLHGKNDTTREGLVTDLTTPGFDLENSTRIVLNEDDKIIAYSEVWDVNKPQVHPWIWGRVHPEYEGHGIGTAILTWADQRAKQVVDNCPPHARIAYRTGVPSNFTAAHDLFVDFGMEPIRHSYRMLIDMSEQPPAPVLPEGLIIRSVNYPDELEATVRAIQEAFLDHWGFVARPVEEDMRRWQHHNANDSLFDPSVWFIAVEEASGEIAGMSLCRTEEWGEPNHAYVATLGVRRPWRKQGVGLALLHHTFTEFWQRGRKQVSLHVDASSLTGATRLYKRAGMHVNREYTQYEKEIRPGEEIATTSAD